MMVDPETALAKRAALAARLRALGSVLVAFSGGTDSALLLAVAHEVLGRNVLAVTAHSALHPPEETKAALRFARARGIRHARHASRELGLETFCANGPDRCYHCKRALFEDLAALARAQGLAHVVHGANRDDESDYRPGERAARELGIIAPLAEAGLTKAEIRWLARGMLMAAWDRAPEACLATRIPYGERITPERLARGAEAEAFLKALGLGALRVRQYGRLAVIELADPAQLARAAGPELRARVTAGLRAAGFEHVALDLEGYVAGKLNRDL